MKKILFTFLSALALFSSCSSDNDTFTENVSDNDNEPKYTVNFDIKSDAFEVDKTPLRSTEWLRWAFLQLIVYKESGEVYSDTVIEPTALRQMIAENTTPRLSLELPKGNYYLSVMNRSMTGSVNDKVEDFKIVPNDYETDYYDRKFTGYYTNNNIYYYTSPLTVDVSNSNEYAITLEPMWSVVKEPNLKYAADFVSPAGVEAQYIQIAPRYYGFGIKSKLARLAARTYQEFDHLTLYLIPNSFPAIVSKAEDSNLFLDICYIVNDGYSSQRIVKVQRINLNTKLENGMNYNITGIIPAIDSIDTHSMHVSLKPFKDTNLTFE